MVDSIEKLASKTGARSVFVRGDTLLVRVDEDEVKPAPDGVWAFPSGTQVKVSGGKIASLARPVGRPAQGRTLQPVSVGRLANDEPVDPSDWWEHTEPGWREEMGWDETEDENWWLWSEGPDTHGRPKEIAAEKMGLVKRLDQGLPQVALVLQKVRASAGRSAGLVQLSTRIGR